MKTAYQTPGAARRAERSFKRGQIVRFCPPEGAYSRASAQRRYAGQTGLIINITESYALVTFGEGKALTINTDYLRIASSN